MTTDPADASLPIAAALACAIDDNDPDAVAAVLTPLSITDLYALAVVLAANIDVNSPLLPSYSAERATRQAVRHAALMYDVPPDEIHSPSRHRDVNTARMVAMTVVRLAGHSLPTVGQLFGRDHTTVLHAVRRTNADPRMKAAVNVIAARMGIEIEEVA